MMKNSSIPVECFVDRSLEEVLGQENPDLEHIYQCAEIFVFSNYVRRANYAQRELRTILSQLGAELIRCEDAENFYAYLYSPISEKVLLVKKYPRNMRVKEYLPDDEEERKWDLALC